MNSAEQIAEFRRELENLRCRQTCLSVDRELIEELLNLREAVIARPCTPQPLKTPPQKSELVRQMEAIALLDGYANDELHRLKNKLDKMENDSFAQPDIDEDQWFRQRNETMLNAGLARLPTS